MPIYEYRCADCGARFERIQKFSDAPLEKCEKCGGKLERLLSSPAIQFKGSGWYVTDYARKPETAAKAETTEKPEKVATPTDGGGKAENTRPAKTEAKTPPSAKNESC